MVSSIVPGTTGTSALGVDGRYQRAPGPVVHGRDGAQGDRVEFSAAALAAARESVRAGVAQVREALAFGQDAQALLVNVQEHARSAGAQGDLDAMLGAYRLRVEAALGRGAGLLKGESLVVQAEPGAAPVTIAGLDLRLGGAVISLADDARIDDPALGASAQRSLDALQEAVGKLVESARALDAHLGFIAAAERASGVRDLDADGARLLALQVRQGLEAAGTTPIANADPQAVLALFRV